MTLAQWIDAQARRSAALMENSLSATQLCKQRPAFRQTVRPAAGSVLASPAMADWDPNPDYFFHWVRDSAIVMNAVTVLSQTAATEPERQRWHKHWSAFIAFSLALSKISGAVRPSVEFKYAQFLRPASELDAPTLDQLLGEPRFNPDASLDIFQWSRPQYDGPALRALSCLRYRDTLNHPDPALDALLRQDLDFTVRYADVPCIGLWEEQGEIEHHYHTAVVQLGALYHGTYWVDTHDRAEARRYRAAITVLQQGLRQHWLKERGYYCAIRDHDELDAAVILGVLDARLPAGAHSLWDEKVQQTLACLEALFARELPINHRRPAGCGPALGRSRADRYFGGGAWYPTTLAAAEFYYRLGQLSQGDAMMATVRRLTPANGELSEQLDRVTGAQTSARHLTWSYAAFITAAHARHQLTVEPTSNPSVCKPR